jgi:Ni,Fe-hydrogenase I cytochrome b subunit
MPDSEVWASVSSICRSEGIKQTTYFRFLFANKNSPDPPGNQAHPTGNKEGGLMTREARLMSGIILLTVPTIQYGGYFLLTSLMNKSSGYMDNPLRQNFFRAGHAHAGVIVILSLVCQLLADAAMLPDPLVWLARLTVPLAAILIPIGFFLAVLRPDAGEAGSAVNFIYVGAISLAVGVLTLGVGLLRSLWVA